MKGDRLRRKKSLKRLKRTITLVSNHTKRALLLVLKELSQPQLAVQKIMEPWRPAYSCITAGKGSSKELGNALVKKNRWSSGYFQRRSSVQYPTGWHFCISLKSLRNKIKPFHLIWSESKKEHEIIFYDLSSIVSLISIWLLLWNAS